MLYVLVIAAVLIAWLVLLIIASERDRRMQAVHARARREAERARAQEARNRQPVTVR